MTQMNKCPMAKMCLYSDSNSELSSTFCLVILLLLFSLSLVIETHLF